MTQNNTDTETHNELLDEAEPIRYKDVMDLGFERSDQNDSVWYAEKGYNWFIVTLQLTPNTYLDWDCETRKVEWVRTDDEENILAKRIIPNLEQLESLVKFFNKKVA